VSIFVITDEVNPTKVGSIPIIERRKEMKEGGKEEKRRKK